MKTQKYHNTIDVAYASKWLSVWDKINKYM